MIHRCHAGELRTPQGTQKPCEISVQEANAQPHRTQSFFYNSSLGWRSAALRVSGPGLVFMAIYASLISEIEDAIASGSTDRRTSLLRSITDLFLNGADSFSDDQIAIFDDVIGKLAEHIEIEVRAELARRLAALYRAPPTVIKALASDDAILVARPVLEQSPRLQDADLVDTAQTKSQKHLLAISKRKTLSEVVTDVLVTRGDQEVARSVARNDGALFSAMGFDTLVQRAGSDDILAECVGARKDLTPYRLKKLISVASKKVQEKLLAENRHASEDVQAAVAQVASGIAIDGAVRNQSAAKKRMIEALFAGGKLNESALQAAARNGQFEDVVAALSTLSSMAAGTVETLLLDRHTDTILILAKASELSWDSAKSLLTMELGGQGPSYVDLTAAFENYKRLQVVTAQRILRFYRARRSTMTQTN
jgi:uncharacterized protein (DUF2336 family)